MSRPIQNNEEELRLCIFCLKEKPVAVFDPEHVFPEAIGSRKFVVYNVCRTCNNEIGSRIDTTLSDHFMSKMQRANQQIRSKSGKVPDPLTSKEVTHTDAKTGKPVIVSRDKSGVYVAKPHPGVTHSVTEDGGANSEFAIEASKEGDVDFIKSRLKGALRGHPSFEGAAPPEFSDEQIEALMRDGEVEVEGIKITATRGSIKKVNGHIEIPDNGFELGIIKIVYELAVKWLGPAYLNDSQAQRLRDLVNAGLVEQVDLSPVTFDGAISLGSSTVAPELWASESNWHRAIMSRVGGRLVIYIKVFDLYQGTIAISDSPEQYDAPDMFLTVNPANSNYREQPFHAELMSKMILE